MIWSECKMTYACAGYAAAGVPDPFFSLIVIRDPLLRFYPVNDAAKTFSVSIPTMNLCCLYSKADTSTEWKVEF